MIFILATIIQAAQVIKFDKLEKRTKAELIKKFDEATPSWSYPYVEGQTISKDKCDAGSLGEMTAGHIKDGLNRLNFYRYLVGLDDYEVYHDSSRQKGVMECSRVLDLCSKITHTPKKDGCTACMTNDADQSCQKSNLFSMPYRYDGIAYGIDQFLEDAGSGNAAVGHRRWLLYPTLGNVSFGKARKYGAVRVFGIPEHTNTNNRNVPFVAFPAPGFFPTNYIYERWSFSLPNDGLRTAKSVTHKILADGKEIAATGKLYANTMSILADSTYVMSLNNNNKKACIASQEIVVEITVDSTKVYQYTIRPVDITMNICLCGLCEATEVCYSMCPKGYSVVQLLIQEMFNANTMRQQIHDQVIKAENENRNMQIFLVGQEARNHNPSRIDLDDMTRVNITFVGGVNKVTDGDTTYQYLTLYPTQKGHTDPNKSKRKTTTVLNNIILSDGTHLGGKSVSFPVTFHNLQVNWYSAVQLPSLNVDSLTLLGGDLISKVTFLAGNKVKVFHKDGKSVTLNGKVAVKTDKNSLLATNAVPLSLELENNNIEVGVESGVTQIPSLNIKFTSDSKEKKTVKTTGDWSKVTNCETCSIEAKSGSVALSSSGGSPPGFDVSQPDGGGDDDSSSSSSSSITTSDNSTPSPATKTSNGDDTEENPSEQSTEKDGESDPNDSTNKKKKSNGIGGGAVAGIVIVVIVVVAVAIIGALMFFGVIPSPGFIKKLTKQKSGEEEKENKEETQIDENEDALDHNPPLQI